MVSASAEARARLRVFLTERGCDRLVHRTHLRGTLRTSLSTHLLRTFDRLVRAGCALEVALAGGLHSVYGTSRFATVAIQPSERGLVQEAFGEETEQLVYLFHRGDRPEGLEKGVLVDRASGAELELSCTQLSALRLIEAANLLDQHSVAYVKSEFPVVLHVWEEQVRITRLKWSLESRIERTPPSLVSAAKRLYHRHLPKRMCLGVFVQFGTCRAKRESTGSQAPDAVLYLPLLLAFGVWMFDTERVAAVVPEGDVVPRDVLGFTLFGERAYGMPVAPLAFLNKFVGTKCFGAVMQRRRLDISLFKRTPPSVPLDIFTLVCCSSSEPHSIPLHSLMDSQDEEIRFEAFRRLLQDLRVFGFAIVTSSHAQSMVIQEGYKALTRAAALDVSERKKFRVAFDESRFYGWAFDEHREWCQLRRHVEGDLAITADIGEELRDCVLDMLRATHLLADVSSHLFLTMCKYLGLNFNAEYLIPTSARPVDPCVHRVYKYHDAGQRNLPWHPALTSISGTHADMGLLTVSPRSTVPALRLLKRTHSILRPEEAMKQNEWVVFAGEMFSYMTQGFIDAMLHQVMQEREEPALFRLSMPFFLRATPEARITPTCVLDAPILQEKPVDNNQYIILLPTLNREPEPEPEREVESNLTEVGASAIELTARSFVENHSTALRPWRGKTGFQGGSDF